jgi:hypothetical protein
MLGSRRSQQLRSTLGVSVSPLTLDLFYAGQTDAVPFGYQTLRTRRINRDLISLLRRQLWSCAPAHVLKVSYRLQMVGVAARSLTAKVVKFQPIGDRAVRQHPGHPVGLSASGATVTSVVMASVPDPAGSGVAAVGDGVKVVAPEPSCLAARVVAVNEADRLTLDPSPRLHRLGRERRGLAASAFAEFRRLFSHAGLLDRLTFGGRLSLRRSPHSIRWAS